MSDITQFEILVNQVIRLQKLQDSIKFNLITDDSSINTKLVELINKRIDQIESELEDEQGQKNETD
jgi:hypothetical protein